MELTAEETGGEADAGFGAYEQVLSWRPERVILSHGRCFDANGGAVIRRAFGWALGE